MNDFFNYYILVVLGKHKLLSTKNIMDLIPCSHATVQRHLKYLERINIIKSTKTSKFRIWELNYSYVIKLKKEDEKL